MYKSSKHFYKFGPFRLDPVRRLLFREDQVIPLPPKVLHTLSVLVENSGRVVSKDELIKAIWPDTFVEEGNLTQNISVLRKVLGENPGQHIYIETVPKQGYRFIAAGLAETQTQSTPWLTWRRGLILAAVLSALLVIAAGGRWYSGRSPKATNPLAANSLKVTPLTSYPGLELHPSFAPDGNQVAFAWNGERQDNFDIYIKVVGTDRSLRLTFDAAQDFRPAWSPDGTWIAFLREAAGRKASIIRIPPTGGPERNVAEVDPGYLAGYDKAPLLEWTPDGKWLLTADRVAPGEGSSLFLISVESGQKKRLTSPPPSSLGDVTGAISPDGRTLAFSRNRSGTLGKLCTLEMSGDFTPAGEPNCFAVSDGRLANAGSVRWSPDRREIMFSPLFRGSGRTSLWTIPLPQREGAVATPQRSPLPSNTARDPAFSRDGQRLVYSDFLADADIWRLDLRNTGAGPVKLITSTKWDHGAQYSPNGKKIAFVSDRSGYPDLWVADSDGSNQTRLTTGEFPLVGMPHWSPDEQRIIFDSTKEKQYELYVINADGSGLRRLTHDPADDAVGRWSHDGRWIYFVSTRSGKHQIWKMPVDGGDPIQITKHGGEPSLFESADGKFVYYTKSIGASTGAVTLWRTPVTSGEEVKVLDSLFSLQWTVAASGIYFAAPTDHGSSHASSIRFLSFRTGKITTVAPREWGGQPGVSVSPDGRFLLYSFAQLIGSDLMLVEGF
jgi:Tol biopolymer transport system component/DNA-binding winged helix-turn-helix (wHTH) protein